MNAGAIGMTTGLIYPPGTYAREDEIVEMLKVTEPYGGVYASHMRNESDMVVQSVEETIQTGRKAGVNVIISHHKIMGRNNFGKSKDTLMLVDKANAGGIHVRLDQYPFNAGSTALINSIPPEYATDGQEKLIEKLGDINIRNEIKLKLSSPSNKFENLIYNAGIDGVKIGDAPGCFNVSGKSLHEIAQERGKDAYDILFDIIIQSNGLAAGIYFVMGEEDIKKIIKHDYVMVGTDAGHIVHGMSKPSHPRYTSTFTRILSHYVRDLKLISLEKEINKMTYMPASYAGIKNKGLIKEGFDADIAIFDFKNLQTTADFQNPSFSNKGMEYVIVNGKIALEHGFATNIGAGKVIRKNK